MVSLYSCEINHGRTSSQVKVAIVILGASSSRDNGSDSSDNNTNSDSIRMDSGL